MMTMIHDSSGGENKVLQYFIIKKTDKIKNFYATKHNGQMFVVKQKKDLVKIMKRRGNKQAAACSNITGMFHIIYTIPWMAHTQTNRCGNKISRQVSLVKQSDHTHNRSTT